jgi:hypothetical protein
MYPKYFNFLVVIKVSGVLELNLIAFAFALLAGRGILSNLSPRP